MAAAERDEEKAEEADEYESANEEGTREEIDTTHDSGVEEETSEEVEEYEKPESPTDSTRELQEIRRHSYEYARSRETFSLRPSLSRNDSALTAVSRLRSRKATTAEPFSHPLVRQKTGPDVLVDFDGKDDPYRPLNWPFKKKVITTLLYGLNHRRHHFCVFGILCWTGADPSRIPCQLRSLDSRHQPGKSLVLTATI